MFKTGPLDRALIDAIADDPEMVDELHFRINAERKTAEILARHGFSADG